MPAHVVEEDLGIHEVAVEVFVIHNATVEVGHELGAGFFEVDGGQCLAGAFG